MNTYKIINSGKAKKMYRSGSMELKNREKLKESSDLLFGIN